MREGNLHKRLTASWNKKEQEKQDKLNGGRCGCKHLNKFHDRDGTKCRRCPCGNPNSSRRIPSYGKKW